MNLLPRAMMHSPFKDGSTTDLSGTDATSLVARWRENRYGNAPAPPGREIGALNDPPIKVVESLAACREGGRRPCHPKRMAAPVGLGRVAEGAPAPLTTARSMSNIARYAMGAGATIPERRLVHWPPKAPVASPSLQAPAPNARAREGEKWPNSQRRPLSRDIRQIIRKDPGVNE